MQVLRSLICSNFFERIMNAISGKRDKNSVKREMKTCETLKSEFKRYRIRL